MHGTTIKMIIKLFTILYLHESIIVQSRNSEQLNNSLGLI